MMGVNWLAVGAFAILVAGGVWLQTMLWDECRGAGHSWFYCLHITGR